MTELQLYSWGANSHGQLGLGFESEMCTTPTKVPSKSSVELNQIIQIQGGGGHILILDKNHRLHSCGWNNKGQLGINSISDAHLITAITEFDVRMVDMACGWDSSAAIDETGELYVWGSNAFEQLGFSAEKTASHFKTPVHLNLPCNEKVQRISFGLRFMCILCEGSTVYVVGRWKYEERFEIVRHNDTKFYRLSLLPHLSGVKQIASGSNHTVCIVDSNCVIGFGDNKFNQCERQSLGNEKMIVFLRSGWTHNGILTENGSVYLWGRNSYGQLGNSKPEISSCLRKLEGIDDGKIINFHLGSEHGMIVTENGSVYTWGWNEHGNCGTGNETNVYVPARVPLPGKCILSATGAGFCFALVR